MKTLGTWILVCGMCTGAVLAMDGFSQADRTMLIQQLEKSDRMLEEAVRGLSDPQAVFHPNNNTWSVADCIEHIVLAEGTIRGLVVNRVVTAPATSPDGQVASKDKEILEFTADRSQTFSAPQTIQPQQSYKTLEEALAAFRKAREETLEYVKTTTADLRAHKSPNPVLGDLDGVQWLLFMSGHTERHIEQIIALKSSEGFPAR